MRADRPHDRPTGDGAAARHLQLLYNLLATWGLAIALPATVPLTLVSAKRRATFCQRMSLIQHGRVRCSGRSTNSPRTWVHALSVGEVRSAIPLVRGWQQTFAQEALVFSASTLTGYTVARNELGGTVDSLFYYPYDLIFAVRRTVRRAAAHMVILVETDIWPNFLFEMQRRKVPVVLVNGKLSERSWRGYRRIERLIRPLFATLSLVCAQTDEDAARLAYLGVKPDRLEVTGNIKFDQASPEADDTLTELNRHLGLRPGQRVIVAGSTHPGEEAVIGGAWRDLRVRQPDVKLIVAPRDPARAPEVRRYFAHTGHAAVVLSSLASTDRHSRLDVLVIDRIGLLSRLYALADVAVVGGSLVAHGGHNPLEPAAWSRPIVFGPDMSDFSQIAELLLADDGALQVQDRAELSKALDLLLQDRRRASELGTNAYRVFKRNQGAVARTLGAIRNLREVADR